MAIGWLSILRSVPWSQVISNAPKVADGAKKLWNAVAKKTSAQRVSDASLPPSATSESQTLAALEIRVMALEAAVADLHSQMLASSELIRELADQNAQQIQRIEINRVRVLWLGSVVSVTAMVVLVAAYLAFFR